VLWAIKWRKKSIELSFKSAIKEYIIPNHSLFNEKLKSILMLVAFVFLIIAIANPQLSGAKQEKVKGQGIDIMILLDVSNSMLAQDIQPNRLERSKLFISKLLDNLKHDRVGLIVFAGNSYLQVPLTIDFSSIKMSLPIIDPADIPSQGTNIGEAVELAEQSLGLTDSKNKAIVVITDGEDHDQNADNAIAAAKKNGIKVFAIGVGEEKGAPIPMGSDYKKDENGQVIMTAFNRKMLEQLATIGNGSFYHLGQQSDIVEDVANGLNQIEGKEFEDFDFSNYTSYFYWFAIIALLLIAVEFMMPNIKWKQFVKNISVIAFMMLLSGQSAFSQSKDAEGNKEKARTYIRRGNSNFQNKKYQDAELNYRKAISLNPNNNTAKYNLGNALYQQQKYQEAAEQYQSSVEKNDDKLAKARAYHNLGNSYFKNNQLENAIKAYENSLKLNPSDMDTKFNLALAKKQQDKQGGGKNNQQQQQQQQSQGQQKQDDKGKGDDKKDGNGEKPKEKEGDGNQQPEKKNDGKGMSKEQAQKLLEALKNQEQNTQNKVDAKKAKPEQKKNEKDW